MDNKDTPNNTSWLALLRKKVRKKFKRNRQKLSNSYEVSQEPEIIHEETENFLATSSSTNGFSTQDCAMMKKELIKVAWYWPGLSRLDAQKLLSSSQNGSFLLRDSSEIDSFTLSFRTNSKTFHCRNQWSKILATPDSSHTLIDIIEKTIKKSQSSVVGFVKCDNNEFPTAFAVRLIYPICRRIEVPSLQNLCLYQIKSKVNQSSINSLPLPAKIQEYVRENYNTL